MTSLAQAPPAPGGGDVFEVAPDSVEHVRAEVVADRDPRVLEVVGRVTAHADLPHHLLGIAR